MQVSHLRSNCYLLGKKQANLSISLRCLEKYVQISCNYKGVKFYISLYYSTPVLLSAIEFNYFENVNRTNITKKK